MNMTHRNFILIAAMMTLNACAIGGNAENWAVAKGPAGAMVDVKTSSANMKAELMEVGDEGVVLRRSDGKLVFARYASINHLRASRQGAGYKAGGRVRPSAVAMENLKLISHFPHGITPEIRARLLTNAGQSEYMVVE
jgi:hypothetical protein